MNLPTCVQLGRSRRRAAGLIRLYIYICAKQTAPRADRTSRFISANVCDLHLHLSNSTGQRAGRFVQRSVLPTAVAPRVRICCQMPWHSCDSLCDRIPLPVKCSMSGFIRQCDKKTFLSEVYAMDRPPLMCGIRAKNTSFISSVTLQVRVAPVARLPGRASASWHHRSPSRKSSPWRP